MPLKNHSLIILLFSIFVLFFSGKSDYFNHPTPREIIDQMLKNIDNIKTLSYDLKVSERIKGVLLSTTSYVKLQKNPRKLYLYLNGPELLWIEGKNNGNAFVNPKTFPFINLYLDTYSELLRKDQHHTIHEVGFDYIGDIIRTAVKKIGHKFEKNFLYIGEEKYNDRPCYKIIILYPEFAYVNYTLKKGENLVSIARRFKISEYMILENNSFLGNYSDGKAGTQLKIPNAYSKMTTLLIDKEWMLPINNKIFDDKGLFEAYEYHNLKISRNIPEEEFTKEYKDYHF